MELQLLVKAANLFPAGTNARWRNVAEYVSNHAAVIGGNPKTEKEVIKQVKALTLVDANSAPASQIKESGLITNSATVNASDESASTGADAWTAEQQKQLESALKNTPSSDPNRWEKIATTVEGKTKKECVKRYKELAELVKQNQSKNPK